MSPTETIANLKDFVFKGPFRDQGMPDFTGKLKEEDIPKLQAFIQGTADAIRPKYATTSLRAERSNPDPQMLDGFRVRRLASPAE